MCKWYKFYLYIYICFNWVAMVIIGYGNLGKFRSGEGCSMSRVQYGHVLEVLDYYH